LDKSEIVKLWKQYLVHQKEYYSRLLGAVTQPILAALQECSSAMAMGRIGEIKEFQSEAGEFIYDTAQSDAVYNMAVADKMFASLDVNSDNRVTKQEFTNNFLIFALNRDEARAPVSFLVSQASTLVSGQPFETLQRSWREAKLKIDETSLQVAAADLAEVTQQKEILDSELQEMISQRNSVMQPAMQDIDDLATGLEHLDDKEKAAMEKVVARKKAALDASPEIKKLDDKCRAKIKEIQSIEDKLAKLAGIVSSKEETIKTLTEAVTDTQE